MKFSSAIIASVSLHVIIVLIAYFYPESTYNNDTTYYVDLVQLGGSPQKIITKSKVKSDKASGETVSVKDLSVKKEKISKITYPDKDSKRKSKKEEEEKFVSVVKREKTPKNIDPVSDSSDDEEGDYVRTGLSGSGLGEGGTGGNFPYAYYVETLKSKIKSSWYNPLSSSGISGKFLAVVYFRIFRDGSIGSLKLQKKSGNKYYDLSTIRVIKEVVPFPPLPSDYPELYLGVYFEFEWER